MADNPQVTTQITSSGLFARNATGLVRGVSQRSGLVINFITAHPTQALAAGFFFVFALFPGGNYLIGLVLTVPLVLAMAYSFGLLTSMIPRSGGDYMLVSRVIHPAAGLISSFCMTLAAMLSLAYFGVAFVTIGIGPALTGLGLIEHSHTLISWGTTIQADSAWKFAAGTAMLLVAALFLAGGWHLTLRIQNTVFWIVTLGLVAAIVPAIFTSRASFAKNFNRFLAPYTHQANSYNSVLAKATRAGVNVHPAFSWGHSIPIIGFFATFAIYTWWSTFIGGELREASSVKTARNMALAGVISLACVGICAAILFRTFGTAFMTAANGGGMPAQVTTAPTYFFLMAGSVGNSVYAVILFVCYILYWPLVCYISFLQPTRMLFAYAFDGILPKAVTNVTRKGAPWVALLISWILAVLTLLWGINAGSFFQLITYATLIQLIAMGLVCLSGVLVPWLRPQIYRGSSTQKRFLGIPVVSIAGAGGIATAVFVWILYFHYASDFGFTDSAKFFGVTGGTIVLSVIYYLGAKLIRARQGVNINLAYAEIPPE